MTAKPPAARLRTIIPTITLNPTIPILKFKRSNKLKYGSQILRANARKQNHMLLETMKVARKSLVILNRFERLCIIE